MKFDSEDKYTVKLFQIRPYCNDYLWGGRRLTNEYGIETERYPLAEAWMLSSHKDGLCHIMGSSFDGMTLEEYQNKTGDHIFGNSCNSSNLPIIKLIDAEDDLAIQVHPDDEYALKNEHQLGKVECWYILDAEPDASIYYGFTKELTKDEFVKRITEGTLKEVVRCIKVHKGDFYYIPSGFIHAIGKGIIVAEVQENSNVTYRIDDFKRKDQFGHFRTLQITQAIDVTVLDNKIPSYHSGNHLIKNRYFTVDIADGSSQGKCTEKSYISMIVLSGSGFLELDDHERAALHKGQSWFISAHEGKWRIKGKCRLLITQTGV